VFRKPLVFRRVVYCIPHVGLVFFVILGHRSSPNISLFSKCALVKKCTGGLLTPAPPACVQIWGRQISANEFAVVFANWGGRSEENIFMKSTWLAPAVEIMDVKAVYDLDLGVSVTTVRHGLLVSRLHVNGGSVFLIVQVGRASDVQVADVK